MMFTYTFTYTHTTRNQLIGVIHIYYLKHEPSHCGKNV